MDPASSDRYWCSEDEEAFAKSYFAHVDTQGKLDGFGVLTRLQLLARRHYYGALPFGFVGDMPSSAIPNRSGEQGENVEVRVNWLRAHANAKHQIIVAPKLAWGTQATNTDAKSLADASRGGSILEYLWKTGPFESMALSAELGAILCGEEFLFTRWNPQAGREVRYQQQLGRVEYEGDIDCHLVPAWDVLRQPSAKSFEASPWLSVRLPLNRWDLVAQYATPKDATPEAIEAAEAMRKKILATPAQSFSSMGMGGTSITSTSDSDIVSCHFFFHKKTPAMPVGLQAVLLSADCVLEFGALEKCYQHLPVHRFQAENLKGTPYAYTSFWEAMGVQDLCTDLQGSLATNIMAFAKQMISAESDQDLPINQLGNGPAVLYRPKGSQPPVPLNLMAPNPEMFQHLERYKSDQRMILGLNDMAMGEPPQGPPNAQAWALLATANITNNSGEQRGFIEGVKSAGRSLLAIIKAKFTTPRKAAIVGVYGAAVPEQDEFDASDFSGIDDVTVTIDNPLMQTAAGRLPIAQMYLEQGFVQVPEQLEQLISTGKTEPMTQVLRNELIYIAWENEQILKGINPPVMITDSQQLHIREHKDAMFMPDGRSNPAVIEAYNAHQQQHFELALQSDPRILGLLGQAAPAPQMPVMPGAPEGAKAGEPLMPPGAAAQGKAAEVKLPTAPLNPATGSPATPPGGLA